MGGPRLVFDGPAVRVVGDGGEEGGDGLDIYLWE